MWGECMVWEWNCEGVFEGVGKGIQKPSWFLELEGSLKEKIKLVKIKGSSSRGSFVEERERCVRVCLELENNNMELSWFLDFMRYILVGFNRLV